jgi:hypothetical protein
MALKIKLKEELKSWIYYAIIEVNEQYQITYGELNETLIELLHENNERKTKELFKQK